MAQSPWKQGDTREAWAFQLIPDTGDFSTVGLTSSNFSYHTRNISNGVERKVDVVFSNPVSAVGDETAQITYQPSTTDVGSLGMYHQWVKVTEAGKIQTFDFGVLSIEKA